MINNSVKVSPLIFLDNIGTIFAAVLFGPDPIEETGSSFFLLNYGLQRSRWVLLAKDESAYY
jgi:hypothetical protein